MKEKGNQAGGRKGDKGKRESGWRKVREVREGGNQEVREEGSLVHLCSVVQVSC